MPVVSPLTMDVHNFQPCEDMLVVKLLRRGETKGGIALPEGFADESITKCEVISMGPGRESDLMAHRPGPPSFLDVEGTMRPIQVGDIVTIKPPEDCGVAYAFESASIGGEKYVLIRFKEVLGCFKQGVSVDSHPEAE